MDGISREQIRQFRLHAHYLDTWYHKDDIGPVAGACGFQNTPPGAWENALHNRVPDFSLDDMKRMLEVEKTLLQAWSFRGAPVVFPTSESDAFLVALISKRDEPWIYTQGIQLALDFLRMPMGELLELLKQVMPKLDNETIKSKTALDQTLADWILPLLPPGKKDLWDAPSMYGSPNKQTVGGAIASFLLRPCAFMGLVVFGKREGTSPTYTSYKNWTGHPLDVKGIPEQKLARKYLHCYGPATLDSFMRWLGCSTRQARRMWESVSDEMEPVLAFGKKAFILSADRERLLSPQPLQRELLLLGSHDPLLDQRNHDALLSDKSLHRQVWKRTTNPGVILRSGKIIGIWTSKKKGKGIDLTMTLWDGAPGERQRLHDLAEEYAAFRQQKLMRAEV